MSNKELKRAKSIGLSSYDIAAMQIVNTAFSSHEVMKNFLDPTLVRSHMNLDGDVFCKYGEYLSVISFEGSHEMFDLVKEFLLTRISQAGVGYEKSVLKQTINDFCLKPENAAVLKFKCLEALWNNRPSNKKLRDATKDEIKLATALDSAYLRANPGAKLKHFSF